MKSRKEYPGKVRQIFRRKFKKYNEASNASVSFLTGINNSFEMRGKTQKVAMFYTGN